MKTNNKGFTLAELLVSVVIFGVVLVAAFGFMLASAKSYNKVNDRLEIQTRSQMALNLIEEYVIDSTGGLYFDPLTYNKDTNITYSTLYILGKTTVSEKDTICDVDIFRFNVTNSILEYSKTTATQGTIGNDGIIPYTVTIPKEFYEVTQKIVSFDIDEPVKYLVNITIGMSNRSATYNGKMKIALRNKPPQIVLSSEE